MNSSTREGYRERAVKYVPTRKRQLRLATIFVDGRTGQMQLPGKHDTSRPPPATPRMSI
jgi:hypothetical protein